MYVLKLLGHILAELVMHIIFLSCVVVLMREPVLHDKLVEHNRFCLHATRLMERTGTKPAPLLDASLDRIRRVCCLIL